MIDFTIAQEYTLPSEGKVYKQNVNPQVKLRSMTTAEEMKRLNHSDRPYKAMSEIIDDCLVSDLGISAYDLCITDYQYLLHRLRVVTYGPEYKLTSTCPYCGSVNKNVLNLDHLNITTFDKEMFDKYSEITLPVTKKRIKLRMQSPRILDDINIDSKEQKRRSPNMVGDPAFLITLKSLIETVDDVKYEEFKLMPFIQKLPMMDTNYILKSAQKLNTIFGIDTQLLNICSNCGLDYTSSFRTTSEFFGPSID